MPQCCCTTQVLVQQIRKNQAFFSLILAQQKNQHFNLQMKYSTTPNYLYSLPSSTFPQPESALHHNAVPCYLHKSPLYCLKKTQTNPYGTVQLTNVEQPQQCPAAKPWQGAASEHSHLQGAEEKFQHITKPEAVCSDYSQCIFWGLEGKDSTQNDRIVERFGLQGTLKPSSLPVPKSSLQEIRRGNVVTRQGETASN